MGDLSTPTGGGPLSPHFSHRSGVDADLLFYVTTLGGAPVDSPGFIHVGADGLAEDEAHERFLRFDVEREWLLVQAPSSRTREARVQWIFVSDVVQAMLIEWAIARGESPEIDRARAERDAPAEPGRRPRRPHPRAHGVLARGARGRAASRSGRAARGSPTICRKLEESDRELALALFRPIDAPATAAKPAPSGAPAKSRP